MDALISKQRTRLIELEQGNNEEKKIQDQEMPEDASQA